MGYMIEQLPWMDGITILGTIAAILAAFFAWKYGRKSTQLMEEQLKISKRESYPEREGELEKIGFLITDVKRYKLTYVHQDEKEHLVEELILPAYKEVPIMIWLKPSSNYTVEDRYFGCEGDYEKKPEPISYFNPFILRGKRREITPEEDSDHYVDFHKYYHTKKRQEYTKDEVYVAGYKIKTYEEGDYRAQYIMRTPNTVKTYKLQIKVRKESIKEKTRCLMHENCYINHII